MMSNFAAGRRLKTAVVLSKRHDVQSKRPSRCVVLRKSEARRRC